ncbi:MAG: O-antigen polysaccharide polymerase Wzy [Calditrichaceae bacterium]|nr:O-antigen polysaccharide polymerase Wzy [Calditrichaceae bacterium]MBN2708173.1 O-antigen polysaccharide polymerase Wzy [Calditrichaceae bacterium]RQV97171.1 MAG: O-antigen polysaccharide polymerase Wzy [Calditrichota bacterium]
MHNHLIITLKLQFYILFGIINLLFICWTNSPTFLIKLTFIYIFLLIYLLLYYHLFIEEQNIAITSFIIFNYLFFVIGPVVQLKNHITNDLLPNTFIINYNYIIQTNLYIVLFLFVFIVSYLYLKNRQKNFFRKPDKTKLSIRDYQIVSIILIIITIFIMMIYSNIIYNLFFFREKDFGFSTHFNLIISRTLFMLPLSVVILSWYYRKTKKIFLALFFISLILLIFLKNPFTDKRNAIGAIYLCILFFMFPVFFKTNFRTFIFLFTIMVILFPLSSIFTHSMFGFALFSEKPIELIIYEFTKSDLLDEFNRLDYDTWSEFNTTIEYVNINGISYGKQLGNALLFFIPRAIWPGKPLNSGFEIGNYIMNNYPLNYNNLSESYVAEGYINFGIIGILIYPIILSISIIYMSNWLKSKDILKKTTTIYFSFHLVFLLRGDFTNGFVYFIGTYIAVYLIPKFILFLLRILRVSNHSILKYNYTLNS